MLMFLLIALRKEFEMKRKAHYNEYYAVKLARKLLEEEEDEEDEEENGEGAASNAACCSSSSKYTEDL